jgi:MFS transporter, ACS family, tartrate transporter
MMTTQKPGAIEYVESRTIRKVSWRLLPLIAAAYCVAYIGRSNVSFAALTMNKDLGLTSYLYGLGAGIFFLGYFAVYSGPPSGHSRWEKRVLL